VWTFLGAANAVAVRTANSAGGKVAADFHVAVLC
jgi:hypothetical protein